MVAVDLLELRPAVALTVHALRPVDEALVERRASALEDSLVRSVADENVVEAVLVLPIGLNRPDQLLLGHRAEVLGYRRPDRFGRKLLDRRLLEDLTDHRRRLDHRPRLGREQVEACCEQGLDRSRDREVRQIAGRHPSVTLPTEQAVVDQHREELFDEERVPFRRGDDPFPGVLGNRCLAEEMLDHEPALLVGQRFQLDDRTRLDPVRPMVEQVRSRCAQQEDRHP